MHSTINEAYFSAVLGVTLKGHEIHPSHILALVIHTSDLKKVKEMGMENRNVRRGLLYICEIWFMNCLCLLHPRLMYLIGMCMWFCSDVRRDDPSLLLVLKWGGELTPAGRVQAEELGRAFRCMYPGGQGNLLSLCSLLSFICLLLILFCCFSPSFQVIMLAFPAVASSVCTARTGMTWRSTPLMKDVFRWPLQRLQK